MNNQNQNPGQQAAEQYFSELPIYIQESIKQSGLQFKDAQEMRQFVENLTEGER